MFRKQFTDVRDACALAQQSLTLCAKPLIVLVRDLRLVAASRSFYLAFKVNPDLNGPCAAYCDKDCQASAYRGRMTIQVS